MFMAAACSDPKLKSAQDARNERIQEHFSDFITRELEGPARMEKVKALDKALGHAHAEQLKAARKEFKTHYARELRRWRDGAPQRRRQLEALLNGNPQQIPDALRAMLY